MGHHEPLGKWGKGEGGGTLSHTFKFTSDPELRSESYHGLDELKYWYNCVIERVEWYAA